MYAVHRYLLEDEKSKFLARGTKLAKGKGRDASALQSKALICVVLDL